MTLEKLICELIQMRDNDLVIQYHFYLENGLPSDYEKVDRAFELLQTQLTKILINCRYHEGECVCQPENTLTKLLVKNADIYEKELYPNQYDFLLVNYGKELEE